MPKNYYRLELRLSKPTKALLLLWQKKVLKESGLKISLNKLASHVLQVYLSELEKSP